MQNMFVGCQCGVKALQLSYFGFQAGVSSTQSILLCLQRGYR